MEQWWWWHGAGFMWIFPGIFAIICLVFFFMIMSRGPGWFNRRWDRPGERETAREILDRRFAAGEITKEQYEEMRRVLGT
ncbi:MAG: SHOCT domain-containing protein [Burkholderiales bacterium]